MAKLGLAHKLYTGDISYDFIGHRKRWYAISALLLAISIGALLIRGLNLGIEFRGGAEFTAEVPVTAATVDDVKNAITGAGVPDMDATTVLTVGGTTVRAQTRSLSASEVTTVRGAIAKTLGTQPEKVAYSLIGASWGQQITTKAVQALIVFLVAVMLLIWLYFRDWKMSVAAIVALLHDLVLTVGIYALVGFTVTPATLIGVLTILGYSLYDTVVVFDKVRENVRDLKNSSYTYSQAANNAVNQVLVRSLNTTVIGVLPVAAILFAGAFVLGSGPLEDLGLALFVGMVSGAYSSIFIATPLLAQLREMEPGMKAHREALARRTTRSQTRKGATARTQAAAAPTLDVPIDVVAAPTVEPIIDQTVPAPEPPPSVPRRAQPQRTSRSQRKK